jgi:transcriptional regulator with XRE-family HTH domain
MIRERLLEVIKKAGLSNEDLEKETDISAGKWANLRTKKQRANEDHIRAICNLYPEYAYWITTGLEIPQGGQISPITEATRQNLQKVG